MMQFPSSKRLPVAKEGLPFIFGFLAAALIVSFIPFFFFRIIGFVLFILGAFSVYFFRDPDRRILDDPSIIVAPGEGRILEVSEEFNPDLGETSKVVRIFLSVFDVHVQRSPITGKVTKIEYHQGKFLDARNPRAAFENEQNTVVIENERCKVAVKQIAGFIARRIICGVRLGESVRLSQRLGLIRFGSQVDLYLPKDVELCVSKGDRVMSGVSVVAIQKHLLKKSSSEEVKA